VRRHGAGPTIASPHDSTLANTWCPAAVPGEPVTEILDASIASWSTLIGNTASRKTPKWGTQCP
jgi:hypothetical protein